MNENEAVKDSHTVHSIAVLKSHTNIMSSFYMDSIVCHKHLFLKYVFLCLEDLSDT